MATKSIKSTPSIPTSLSQFKKAVEEKPQKEEKSIGEVGGSGATERVNQPYSEEELLEAWQKFAFSRKDLGKETEYMIMNQKPRLREGDVIAIYLTSTMQEEIFQNFRGDLLDYLRNTLQHFGIQIETELQIQTETARPYTQSDKFAHMAAKNPLLHTLRDKLGLDPDY
ncbi:hypothetical protein QWY31_10640 [Cytophagales bacterium LB-30]|uniref:DNA polymerase III subunit gamma/tau n=1 Tax=Shiella aurantiaca TaxID=3058365 RepID=A0ABT8F6A2_9BACT|nr:hypothetical protein [Shiella aurantiaca]MDN4165962.1 hypothetical protein [Shiella aurantiaca]